MTLCYGLDIHFNFKNKIRILRARVFFGRGVKELGQSSNVELKMAAKKHIHSEDVVRFLKTKDGSSKIGLVLRSGDNISDSDESSCSSEEDVKVKNGEILVCWYPSGQEEVVRESKVCYVFHMLYCLSLCLYFIKRFKTWKID